MYARYDADGNKYVLIYSFVDFINDEETISIGIQELVPLFWPAL
jgi:hypothetical protein